MKHTDGILQINIPRQTNIHNNTTTTTTSMKITLFLVNLVLFTVILQITAKKAPPLPDFIIKLHQQQEKQIHEVKEDIKLLAKSLLYFAKNTPNKQFKQLFSPQLFKIIKKKN